MFLMQCVTVKILHTASWGLGSHSLPPEDFYFGAIVPFKAPPQCYKTVLCLFLPVASITLRPYPVKMQAPSP